MTTQFLILRIQSILDGNTDMNPSQLRAIASEYKRVCEDAERKLVHCASLIKAGRDYAALQVAETEPLLLDSINELLFAKLDSWRTFCGVNSLPCPPSFDKYQIGLLKSLYTREISQTHPLYRDYRRAMRMHNYDAALSIIRTIAKVNKLDSQAKKECEKLERKVALDKFEQAKSSLAQGDKLAAATIASSIKQSGNEFFKDDARWQNLVKIAEEVELENAKNRLPEILKKLSDIEATNDAKEILALAAEFDLTASKYGLEVSPADAEFVKTQSKRASAIQDEILQAQLAANAAIALAAEIEHPEDLPPSKELLKLKDLAKKSDRHLENELKALYQKRCAKLALKIKIARAKSVLVFCLIVCVIATGAFFTKQTLENMEIKNDARRELSIMRETTDDAKLAPMIAKFESNSKELLKSAEFSLPFAKIKDEFDKRKALEVALLNDLKTAENFDKKTKVLSDWNEVFEKLDEAEKGAISFADSRREAIKDSASAQKRALRNALNELRNEIANAYALSIENAAKIAANIDVLSENAFEDIDAMGVQLQHAKEIAESPNSIFKVSQIDADKLAELSLKLQTASESIAKAHDSKKAMLESENSDEYFAELERFKTNPNLSAKEVMEIENMEGLKGLIENKVYGGFSRKLAMQAPEKFVSEGIDFSDKDLAQQIYKCADATRTFYVCGKVTSRKQTWRGGSETTQTAMVIGANGALTETLFRLNRTDGMSPRGREIITNELSAESKLAIAAAELSQKSQTMKAIELTANSSANPIFKVWLEKKLLDALSSNEIASGLAYSPSLVERKKKVDTLAKELEGYSWIFATSARTAFVKSELYSAKIPDFEAEAAQNRLKAISSASSPLKFAGFADSNGKIVLKDEASGKLFGLTQDGEWGAISDTQKPKRFSPLFKK